MTDNSESLTLAALERQNIVLRERVAKFEVQMQSLYSLRERFAYLVATQRPLDCRSSVSIE